MPEARILVAAMAMVLAGELTACGSSSSSPSTSAASTASKADFCRTFDHLGPETSPPKAADQLNRVGTPADMDSGARHGFEVLVDHLRHLPARSHAGRIAQLVRDLNPQDAADLRAFITYYARECQGFTGDDTSY
jgi:hypothetical protein